MSFDRISNNKKIDLDDVTYYNLTITDISPNNSGTLYGFNAQSPKPANINTNQTIPILENPDDYFASVIRFSVPCFSLPVIQFLVQTPVNDINLGIYSFTLTYQNYVSTQSFLRFVPERTPPATVVPPTGTATQTFSNYYFIYDYTHLMGIFNLALQAATTDLNTQAGLTLNAPFFHYDADTSRFSLYADASTFDGYLTNPVNIWFNSAMEPFMQAIPYHQNNYGQAQGLDCQIQIYSGQGLNQKTIGAITYDVVPQQYISLGYMSYLKSIIIATDMNIVSESGFINEPTSLQNTTYTNILTDFLPDLSVPQAGVSTSVFIYNASSLYRIFSFKQKSPLYNVSARIFWTDNLNNVYPLYLNKGLSVQIKFMFIKKPLLKLI